eukprot:1146991-Amphidinium_carterae.3
MSGRAFKLRTVNTNWSFELRSTMGVASVVSELLRLGESVYQAGFKPAYFLKLGRPRSAVF